MRRVAAAAALAVAACASQAQPAPGALPTDTYRVMPRTPPVTSVDLDNAADGTKVTLKAGHELKVLLDADPRSGSHWRAPAKFAPTLSQLGERIFLTKNGIVLGDGGWNVFRFRADKPGTVTLVFEYGPFDDAAPATKSLRYQVTVE